MSWAASSVVACPGVVMSISCQNRSAAALRSTYELYQIEQGEQENPHDVNKVPIQAGQLQHGGVLRTELAYEAHEQDDRENHDAAENVQGVEAGHGEIAR